MFNKISKDKSSQSTLSQLSFVSTLNLEASVQLLSNLADDKHPIILTAVSPDKFQFEIDLLHEGVSLAKVMGSLQRWNGAETKLDARGTIKRLENAGNIDTERVSLVLLAIGLFIFSFVAQNIWFIPIFGFLGFGIYSIAKIFETNEPTQVLFRERDYLFQRLIDHFKAHSELEAV